MKDFVDIQLNDPIDVVTDQLNYIGETAVGYDNLPDTTLVGQPIPWLSSAAIPDGYIQMDGSPIDPAYTELLAIFTSGNIPDLRGQALIGGASNADAGTFEIGKVAGHGHTGSAASKDLGTKTSNGGGDHWHYTVTSLHGSNYDMSNSKPYQVSNTDYPMSGTSTLPTTLGKTTNSGTHTHTLALGSHNHTVSIDSNDPSQSKNTIDHVKVTWICKAATATATTRSLNPTTINYNWAKNRIKDMLDLKSQYEIEGVDTTLVIEKLKELYAYINTLGMGEVELDESPVKLGERPHIYK